MSPWDIPRAYPGKRRLESSELPYIRFTIESTFETVSRSQSLTVATARKWREGRRGSAHRVRRPSGPLWHVQNVPQEPGKNRLPRLMYVSRSRLCRPGQLPFGGRSEFAVASSDRAEELLPCPDPFPAGRESSRDSRPPPAPSLGEGASDSLRRWHRLGGSAISC